MKPSERQRLSCFQVGLCCILVISALAPSLAAGSVKTALSGTDAKAANATSNAKQQKSSGSQATVRQDVTEDAPRPLTERVFFDPNRDEDNKVEDYIANVYFGEVDLAEADPALAADGAAVAAGIQFQYEKAGYFDYETPLSDAQIGPAAKAVAGATARIVGIANAKALAKASGRSNIVYSRDAFSDNSVSLGTVTELRGRAGAGLYLDRTGGNDNDALLQQVEPTNFVFGRKRS